MIIRWSEYSSLNENLQRARSILRRNGVEESDERFQKLRKLLAANPGYLGKFTDWLIIDKVPYERLESLYNTIRGARLSKAIDEFKTPEEVIDTLVRVTADTAVHQMVMSIPSDTRNRLKRGVYCEDCGSERDDDEPGHIDCSMCDGSGEVDCKKCKGEGGKECGRCHGDGETKTGKECSFCEGSGEVSCKSCEGEGVVECPKCKGDCTEECPSCKNDFEQGTRDWQSLLRFFALHADKKDLITGFLSKKSGRYQDDIDDYGYEETIDSMKEDIKKLLNMPSIDAILEKTKTDSDIKLIYNDEDLLIVAVNFAGVARYGSSYWCITEDEGTYDGYVYDNDYGINQQWIVYFRDKAPLVDEYSVMGVTYDIVQKEAYAAHWEDDSDCQYDATNIIAKLKIDPNNIINALSLYSYENDELTKLWTRYPGYFRTSIISMFEKTKEALKKKEEFDNELKSKTGKGRRPSLPRNIQDAIYRISDLVTELVENDDMTKELSNLLKQVAHEQKVFIPVRTQDEFESFIISDLYQYVDYDLNKNNVDLFYIFNNIDMGQEKALEILKYYISKGYEVKKHLGRYSEDYSTSLALMGIIGIEDLLNSDDFSWVENDELAPKIFFHILDNNIRVSGEIYERIISFISKDANLLTKYKDKILDDINKNRVVGRSMLEYILDSIDDDDIELACARKLLHRKILTKYDVEMRKKMLENLMTFENFTKK